MPLAGRPLQLSPRLRLLTATSVLPQVRDFMAAARPTAAGAQPRSSVHQLIMGAGKTTVIAPLLALMLADGQSLVTQVLTRTNPGPARC